MYIIIGEHSCHTKLLHHVKKTIYSASCFFSSFCLWMISANSVCSNGIFFSSEPFTCHATLFEKEKRVKIFSWFFGNYSFLILKQGIHFYSTWKRFKSPFPVKKCCLFLRAPVWQIKWTIKLSTSLSSIRPSQNYLRQLLLAAKIV